MHAAKDYSGAEIMRTLRDEVINRGIPVVEFTSAVELIKDEKGQVAGAVLLNMETGDYSVARAKICCYRNRWCRKNALSGIPDIQPLWCNSRWSDPGIPCRCFPVISGFYSVSIRQELFIRHRSWVLW